MTQWALVGGAGVLAVGILVWWLRRRKKQQHRMISLVALLRQHRTFDPAVLATIAGKVWNADLGDGESQGADGFVVAMPVASTIFFRGRMFLINTFPTPYVDDLEAVAQTIGDQRIAALFREHAAWFSCDALGVDGSTSEDEIRTWYGLLGPLFAELLDEDCQVIYLPDRGLVYAINPETEDALRSPDPVQALQTTQTVPIIEVSADDPRIKQAVAEARRRWPEFLQAYEAEAGENFAVKAPVTYRENTEFIWIAVKAVEGERIYGELGNDPASLGPLKLGSKVSVLLADLNDWGYVDAKGNLIGGFTIQAVQQAAQNRKPNRNGEKG